MEGCSCCSRSTLGFKRCPFSSEAPTSSLHPLGKIKASHLESSCSSREEAYKATSSTESGPQEIKVNEVSG